MNTLEVGSQMAATEPLYVIPSPMPPVPETEWPVVGGRVPESVAVYFGGANREHPEDDEPR